MHSSHSVTFLQCLVSKDFNISEDQESIRAEKWLFGRTMRNEKQGGGESSGDETVVGKRAKMSKIKPTTFFQAH